MLKMVTTTSIPERVADVSIAMLKDMGEPERADALRKMVEDTLAYLRPYGKYLVTTTTPIAVVDGDQVGSCFGKIENLRSRVVVGRVFSPSTRQILVVDDQMRLGVVETDIMGTCRFRNKASHEHLLFDASWESFTIGHIMVGLAAITGDVKEIKAKLAALMAKVDKVTQGAVELLKSA